MIPAYNAEKFVIDTIRSIFRQVYRPLEVIVVDDASTDSTLSLVNNLSNATPPGISLRTINLHRNMGAANALNIGFSMAQGRYVCWLSADDIFADVGKIQKQREHMNRTGALWSYFTYFYKGPSYSNPTLVRASWTVPGVPVFDPVFLRDNRLRLMMLLFKNPINGSSTMISKRCIEKYGQFDPVLGNVDADGDLWMRYSALGLTFAALRGSPVFWREHGEQTSRRRIAMIYGTDLTRLRMLRSLEMGGKLTMLIKHFTQFLLALFLLNVHVRQPATSHFLCTHILRHSREFGEPLVRWARRGLSQAEGAMEKVGLDIDGLLSDVERISHSSVFNHFQSLLAKDDVRLS